MRLPIASTSTRFPGSTTVVQSSCSTIAGPANRRIDRQPLAHVDRRVVPAAGEPHRPRRPPRLGERRRRLRRRDRLQRHRLALADHRGVQVDEHRPDLRKLDAESLPVRRRERCAQLGDGDRGRVDRHRQDVALALELHVGAVQRDDLLDGDVLAREQLLAARDLRREDLGDAAFGERLERLVDGRDEVVAQVGDDAAERVGEPRPRRDEQLRDRQLLRQRRRVQRPGAAEGEQREVARIVAARQAHHADRAGHLVVGDADDRRRRGGRVEAERRADVLEQRGADRRPSTPRARRRAAARGRAGRGRGWRR